MQARATSSAVGVVTSGPEHSTKISRNPRKLSRRIAMFIEIHTIQNFAPSNLNRDDTGSPKDCEFGGHRRARVSSQCWKRAVREYFSREDLIPQAQLAVRTKKLVGKLSEMLLRLNN